MPSVSQAQHAFMAMSQSAKGRKILEAHGKKPANASAAADFLSKDKGRKIGKLPQHVPKK